MFCDLVDQDIKSFLHTPPSSGHLLKNVLVVYVLEHCDEAGQLVLHLVLCHSLCGFLEEIVTVFGQLDGSGEKNTQLGGGEAARSASAVAPVKTHVRRTSACCTHQFGGFTDRLWLSEVHYGRQRLTMGDISAQMNDNAVQRLKNNTFDGVCLNKHCFFSCLS